MSKTLGQVAEKVYLTEMSSGASPTLAFQAVAEAVVMAGLDHMADTVEQERLLPQEHAVIEAARAWARVEVDASAVYDLEQAVEALEALDSEEE